MVREVSDERYFISSEGNNFLTMSRNNGLSMASKAEDISMPVTVRFFFCFVYGRHVETVSPYDVCRLTYLS